MDLQTALHHAARNGHRRCLKVLIDAGARTDIKNKEDKTAMQIAYEMGERECGEYLKMVEGMLLFMTSYCFAIHHHHLSLQSKLLV